MAPRVDLSRRHENVTRATGATPKKMKMHGFAVNGSVTGWGLRNSFFGNTVPVQAASYGFYIHEKGSNGSSDTKVYCSNRVTLAGSGFSNQACIS